MTKSPSASPDFSVREFFQRFPTEDACQQVEAALGAVSHGVRHLDPGLVIDGIVGLTWGVPASLWAAGACWFLFIYGLWTVYVIGRADGWEWILRLTS
mgnify:CR=1 FL=1